MMDHIYSGPQFEEEWFTFSDFYRKVVSESPNIAHFVEIGSWKGRSAAFMSVEIINSGKNIRFDCVDLWPNHSDKETFLRNMEPFSGMISVIHKSSIEASAIYEDSSLDFVFIDACHSYESVYDDILSWLPKVKSGGILAGHDYACLEAGDVRRAVQELLPGHTEESGDCWKFIIP